MPVGLAGGMGRAAGRLGAPWRRRRYCAAHLKIIWYCASAASGTTMLSGQGTCGRGRAGQLGLA